MAKNIDFNEFSDDELSPSRNLKNFGKNGLTDREIRGFTLAANTFLQLIQLEQYRRHLLKRTNQDQTLDENSLQELTSATEDMSQLVSDLQGITPAMATTVRRIMPEIQTNLMEWQKQGKVMKASNDAIVLTAEGDAWWNTFGGGSSSVNGPGETGGGTGVTSTPSPDPGITPTDVSTAVDQIMTTLGPQLDTGAEQLHQDLTQLRSGQVQPGQLSSLVTDMAGAFLGSGVASGDISFTAVGLLFGTLAGVPAIGALVGLIYQAIYRMLAAEEDQSNPQEPIT